MTSSTSCARAAAKSSASVRAPSGSVALQDDRAHVLARRRAAGLAHLDDLGSACAQMLGEQARLRRLAGAVGTLERDEPQAVMLKVFPADGEDDSRTAQEPESAWRNVSLPCLPHPHTSSTGTATQCASSLA